MNYLNEVYKRLKLTMSFGVKTESSKKIEVTISSKNLKRVFPLYLLFAVVMTLFLVIFNLQTDISNIKSFLLIAVIIFILCTAYGLIKYLIIYKTKEPKPTNLNLYNRDLPANLTPAHVRLLLNDGLIDKETLASTILDLIDRGYLKIETGEREDIFKTDLTIYRTNKTQEDLFEYEKYLLDWLFKEEKTTSKNLRNRLNNLDANPSENFMIFEGLVMISFPIDEYYKWYDDSKRKIYSTCIIAFFLFAILSCYINNIYLFAIEEFIVLFGLANFIFASPTYVLNEKGAEIKDSYNDLKRFLNDFSVIEERTSEMVSLWNYYLSYSVALGIDGIAYTEIESFFGNNIYNVNSQGVDIEKTKYFINNIENEITASKELYKRRK